MDKKNTHIKKDIGIRFKEYFYSKSRKINIWRCKDNIPLKNAYVKITYETGCDTLSLFLNGSISPIQILRPGETYTTKQDKLSSIDILCKEKTQEYYSTKRGPCKCKLEHVPVEKPCCCSGNIVITTYKPKPPAPKLKSDFTLILVLFILLVIIGCTSCNRHYYPMC